MAEEIIKVPRSNNFPIQFFDGLFYIYKLGGLYHPEEKRSSKAFILQWVYNITMIISCYVLYLPAEFAMLTYTYKDLNLLVEHVGMLVTHMMGIFKYTVLFFYYKSIRQMMDTLDAEEFKYEDCGTFKPGETMTQGRKWSNILCILEFSIGTMVPVAKQYDSVLKFIYKGEMVNAGNYTCQDMLPYFNWFPFNVETTQTCLVAFVLQSIPMVWYVYPIICGDCSFGCFCFAFRGHFANLRGAFRTVNERCLARLGLPEDFEVLYVTEYPPLQKEIRLEMKRMTIHLQTMIKLCDTFENMVNLITLGQTMTSMFLIVSCLYMITEEEFMSPVFVAEAQYVFAGLFQLFVYCGLGNEITEASSDVRNGIYAAKWYAFTESEKRTLQLNMLRLQRPMQFTTGKFAVLTLSTFVSIVKGSYSYFTFLKQSK